MIDTVKIYTEIPVDTYKTIYNLSVVKLSVDNSKNQMLYEIVNDHLERFL